MTQANNVGQLTPQVNSSGVLQVAGGGTGLSAVGTSGYVLASNGSANVYVSAVGYSGYSGYSGTNGASGTSGYSGATGSNGSAGTSGYSGYSGATGAGASTSFNAVGSYCFGGSRISAMSSGTNYSAGSNNGQIQSATITLTNCNFPYAIFSNNLSGTWKWMASAASDSYNTGVVCRIS